MSCGDSTQTPSSGLSCLLNECHEVGEEGVLVGPEEGLAEGVGQAGEGKETGVTIAAREAAAERKETITTGRKMIKRWKKKLKRRRKKVIWLRMRI